MNNTNTTRKIYLDNIRWITVCIVVIYHVIYMFNGVQPYGVIGAFREHQLQDYCRLCRVYMNADYFQNR